ncbi:helix-turn-helix domain-containing protein [Sinorhizobium medicae]|uniref:helix-turn-helix domain-containing protein n=1 Tax=Sinorhizobium medicae TaxID=110321 RepID=UPI000426F846
MGSAISLRTDFDGARLRLLARQAKDANQARRLLALASIYDGGSRSDAARLGSVTLQIVRDWVVRFNARGPDGLINGKAPGKSSLLNDTQRAALAQAIERGPHPISTVLSAGACVIWASGFGGISRLGERGLSGILCGGP